MGSLGSHCHEDGAPMMQFVPLSEEEENRACFLFPMWGHKREGDHLQGKKMPLTKNLTMLAP